MVRPLPERAHRHRRDAVSASRRVRQTVENLVSATEGLTYMYERFDCRKGMNRHPRAIVRPTPRLHWGQDDGIRHPGWVRESSLHVSDVVLMLSLLSVDSQAEFRCSEGDCHFQYFRQTSLLLQISGNRQAVRRDVPLSMAERDDSLGDGSGTAVSIPRLKSWDCQ